MKMSHSLIPTLREDPKDAEVLSHKLLLRSGFIRKVAAGIYTLLPLGLRGLKKVEGLVRAEMEKAGAIEIQMPIVQPKELWEASGRWEVYGKELLRLKDRKDQEFCLAPTHEEVVTDLIKNEVRSYKQLPLIVFQIHTKFRDEIRPRFGLLRAREFLMKDAYSFDASKHQAMESYRVMYEAYERIFDRAGLRFEAVEADTGAIGGNMSHEFQVLTEAGEDRIARCSCCNKAWNAELAPVALPSSFNVESSAPKEKVKTGQAGSIEEVAALLGIEPKRIFKSLLLQTQNGPFLVVIRGDRTLSLAKFRRSQGIGEAELAQGSMGLPEGQIGPIDQPYPIIADRSAAHVQNGVAGANEPGYHWVNVSFSRDFKPQALADLTLAQEGDLCGICQGPLEFSRGIEVGQVFHLGTKYSQAMGATFLDAQGQQKPFVMGCYGIGIGRTLQAAVEQCHDAKGIRWPASLAPFNVHMVLLESKDGLVECADTLYAELKTKGVEVLYDDREERPGVKFNDADLIGIPFQLIVGKTYRDQGKVEIKARDGSLAEKVLPERAWEWILDRL